MKPYVSCFVRYRQDLWKYASDSNLFVCLKKTSLVCLSKSSGGRLQQFTRAPYCLEVTVSRVTYLSAWWMPSKFRIGSLMGKYILPAWSKGRSSELINSFCNAIWGRWCQLWLFSCMFHHCVVGGRYLQWRSNQTSELQCHVQDKPFCARLALL